MLPLWFAKAFVAAVASPAEPVSRWFAASAAFVASFAASLVTLTASLKDPLFSQDWGTARPLGSLCGDSIFRTFLVVFFLNFLTLAAGSSTGCLVVVTRAHNLINDRAGGGLHQECVEVIYVF